MRTIINDSNFGDIGIAVFYKWHSYIPNELPENEQDLNNLINLCKYDKLLYRGSKQSTSFVDFSEYSFSYNLEKLKFNDQLLINLLDNESKELVGKNIDDLEKINTIMFPTITETEEDYDIEFFGSSIISGQTLLILEADGTDVNKNPGHYKLELYESNIESNNEIYGGFIEVELLKKLGIEITHRPVMTIILGPENKVANNSTDMYFPYDSMLVDKDKNTRLDLLDYRKLYEEITKYKSIWILLSQDDSTIESLNLSYRSWTDSINPNRKMNEHTIRNDEYYSTRNNLKIVEKKEGTEIWYDKNSNTIVGNKLEEYHPILDLKLSKLEKRGNIYSPNVKYNLGDRIVIEDQSWTSISSNNLGNSPITSNNWILSDYINNIFTTRLFVSVSPTNSGSSSPSGSITVDSSSSKTFYITPNLGYKLIEYLDPPNPSPVSNGMNYLYANWNYGNNENEIVIEQGAWVNLNTTGKLVFNFDYVGCNVSFKAILDSVIYTYDQWNDILSGFKLDKIKINEEDQEIEPVFDKNNKINLSPNDKITYLFTNLDRYSVSEISKENTDLVIVPELKDNRPLFSDIIDSNEISYILYLVDKTLTISVIESVGFEVSNLVSNITYGEDYTIQFYGESFRQLSVKNTENQEITVTKSEIGTVKEIGESEVLLEVDKDLYTLTISNIVLNCEISLKA